MAETQAPFVGDVLGAFIAASTWDSIPPSLRHEAKRALLNYFGCALGSAHDPVVSAALKVMSPFSGEDRVTVVGRAERHDPMAASFINAIAGNLLDYDDTHTRTAIHPTAPVAGALLALAEQSGATGPEVLHAFILGVEVECRLGNAVSPGHYARGWHITATCGVFGAAAACAKLLGLTAEESAAALGLAASQAAGVIENLPTAAKNVGVGNAARNGILAALLAQEGYRAGAAAIEGPFGWARAMGDEPVIGEMVDQLGSRWELAVNTYKPYPSGFVFHAVIDAALAIRRDLGLSADDVASVLVEGDQLLLDRGDRPVRTERDARVSIQHAAAIALARGRAGVEDFSMAAVNDPVLAALRGRVSARLSPGMATAAATVTVTARDGRQQTVHVEHAKGSLDAPMTDAELEAKFHSSSGDAVRDGARIAAVWSLEDAADVGEHGEDIAARENAARTVVAPYVVDGERGPDGVRPSHIKERIRALGPTVRLDLSLKPADPSAGNWVI
jgi:2-methylcitrate dehydratase PrpD